MVVGMAGDLIETAVSLIYSDGIAVTATAIGTTWLVDDVIATAIGTAITIAAGAATGKLTL
jgi:hypothetical protein